MKNTTLSKPRQLRLDADSDSRLDSLAVRNRVAFAQLVRLAVRRALPEWEKHGIKLSN